MKEPAEEPAEEPVEEPAEEMVEEQPAEEQKEELAEEQIILASVEGIPLEAKVDFILDNRIIGSVLNGVVVDAVPVPSKDRNRIRAYVANRVKITGAKIHFELLNKEPAEQPVEQPAGTPVSDPAEETSVEEPTEELAGGPVEYPAEDATQIEGW